MLILSLLLASASVEASSLDAATRAEVTRRQSELHALARRGAWSGVDRSYRALIAMEVPLTNSDHLVGYEAARSLGDALTALHRIQRIQQPADHLDEEIWVTSRSIVETFALNYGLVDLVVSRDRLPVLIRSEMPFAPDQRAAVEKMAETLRESREVRGLLPTGNYTIDGTNFTVVATGDWQAIFVE